MNIVFPNGNCRSPIANRKSAMALVITLILLSIITFMAVVFLVVSQRERGSVATATDMTTVRFATDAALERAKAQIIAPMLALTNDQAYDLVVSTNYINGFGFQDGSADPTNVNYQYTTAGAPLTQVQMQQNLANLMFDPRPPVYRTNIFLHTNENQFYLDLNRNGRYDTNGWGPLLSGIVGFPFYDTNGNPALFVSGNVSSNFFVGDPEWIGQLEHPDQPHSATNRFTDRYAFIIIPVSKTLDINYIHNQSVASGDPRSQKALVNDPAGPTVTPDGYLRNQGVGSWEINLAAFLADLNTNQWNNAVSGRYQYNRATTAFPNSGAAFNDARALLAYRYGNDFLTLKTFRTLFSPVAANLVSFGNNIDDYTDAPMQTNIASINETPVASRDETVNKVWLGSDNTNHFFTTQDLYDPTKTRVGVIINAEGFPERLRKAGTNSSSYDRYTYYRLLSQLGMGSRAESTKLNVNYVNVDNAGNIVPLSTNLTQWTPIQFFTNAADKILRTYTTEWFKSNPSNYLAAFYDIHTNYSYGTSPNYITNDPSGMGLTIPELGITNAVPSFGLTNIPVYMNHKVVYSDATHRLLQLAANIYDATTNRQDTGYPYLPSVFRPIFRRDLDTNVFIAGFEEVIDTLPLDLPYMEFYEFGNYFPGALVNSNVYGIPWVIGAKKGFPNFNQLATKTGIVVTRKLRLSKDAPRGNLIKTEQMYELLITVTNGVSSWNSYTANFPRQLEMRMTNDFSFIISTNSAGGAIPLPPGVKNHFGMGTTNSSPFLINQWKKFEPQKVASFITLLQGQISLSNAMYQVTPSPVRFIPSTNAVYSIISSGPADQPMPQWYLISSNRFRYALIDRSITPNRVVDYVNLDMSSNIIDITRAVVAGAQCPPDYPAVWCTNFVNPPPYPNANTRGVIDQIEISKNGSDPGWNDIPADKGNQAARDAFSDFMNKNGGNTNTVAATPFNPTYTTNSIVTWQANDPLVHYILDDLRTPMPPDKFIMPPNGPNFRYQPWSGNPLNPDPQNAFNLTIKDPLIIGSDAWQFPTNLLPNVGWLGRVHRGTPWQTVYMKASLPDAATWAGLTGHVNTNDAAWTFPSQDRLLFDVFTTAINDNASHGQLSVNQAGLAAWSAILSGVLALTNRVSDQAFADNPATQGPEYLPWIIEPAAISSPVTRIVQGINRARLAKTPAGTNVFQDNLFTHIGDILAAPELTERSPYLNTGSDVQLQQAIADAAYERIPQQIMSLLTLDHEPRFVIYAFGQTLRPAPNSVVRSGAFFGLCTNYQITAEMATRTVIRVENAPQPASANANPRVVVESYNILPPD